jgi:hypothetical protein
MSDQSFPWQPPAPTLESWTGEIRASLPRIAFALGAVCFNDDGTVTVDREFGTCFFISGAIFLTAWHVVADAVRDHNPLHVVLLHGTDEDPEGVSFEPVKRVERIVDPEGRETDMAMGFIDNLPPDKQVPRLALSSHLATPGTYVAGYGFARNQWYEVKESDEELADLSMNMVPRFCRGTILAHLPEGRGFSRWPIYVHDAETGGGISGGPLFDIVRGAVCGVNSTGMDNVENSTAVDIRVAFDWPIPFAQNRTLRYFAEQGMVDLR